MSRQTQDFLRAWCWAIEHRARPSRAVLEWMWRRLNDFEDEREDLLEYDEAEA